MKDLFVQIKNLSIITMLVGLLIGIILIIWPSEAIGLVSILCGASVILLGAGAWVSYFTKHKSTILAILGTMALIAGIVICVKYKSIISMILFIFGAFVIISGAVDLISAIDAKKNDLKSWIASIVMSVITIILGIIVIVNPFNSSVVITRILGIGLIAYAIMDLISFIQVRSIIKLNTVKDSQVDEIIIDGEDIE